MVVSSVSVSRVTWGLCLWACWLKTQSSPPSPCESHHLAQHTVHTVKSTEMPRTLTKSFLTATPSRAQPRVNTEFSGTVMGESAMVNTSDVGSLVEFTFNVSHLHHSDYIRPPGRNIACIICALPTSPPCLWSQHRSLILRGEGIVMWAMVCGVSMTRGGYYLGVT